MNLKTGTIGIDRYKILNYPTVTKLNIGSSDRYINYLRGHYTGDEINKVFNLEPEFYLLENLTIAGYGTEKENKEIVCPKGLPVLFFYCNNNYLHFLFENIGRILFLKEKGIEFTTVVGVLSKDYPDEKYFYTHKFLDDPFKTIGIRLNKVVTPLYGYKTITFPKLITTNMDYLIHLDGYSITSKLLRKYFRKNGSPRKNIYISRRYSINNNPRFIHDEEKIEKYYARRGYQIVYNEKLNFTQQVELYKNAKHIVGISGTGLVNILFAPDDCKLTELRTSNYKDDEIFRYICKSLNNEYELITSYDSNGSAQKVLNSIKSHL